MPIVTQPPTKAELETMLRLVGDVKRLFNTSGVVYREQKIGEKLKGLDEKGALALLAGNGRLVKRPFVLLPDRGLLGFREPEWAAAFPRA